MKEMFIASADALDAVLACLSEHDLSALQAMKETFIDGADALDAVLVCLSEHDLSALRNRGVTHLFSAKQKMDQLYGMRKHEIYHALAVEQNRRHLHNGAYEW